MVSSLRAYDINSMPGVAIKSSGPEWVETSGFCGAGCESHPFFCPLLPLLAPLPPAWATPNGVHPWLRQSCLVTVSYQGSDIHATYSSCVVHWYLFRLWCPPWDRYVSSHSFRSMGSSVSKSFCCEPLPMNPISGFGESASSPHGRR